MYWVKKVLNHNAVITVCSENNKEYLILGKGIGFGRKISERMEVRPGDTVYHLQKSTERGNAWEMARSIEPECLEIADEILNEAEKAFGKIDRSILFPMADHIEYAVKRVKNHEQISNPLTEDIRILFHMEYKAAMCIVPILISVDEVRQIKSIVESVKAELEEQGISYGDVEQGIMIETPAAVMISDLLAKEVDFFSIGTNDLTQYTLAIDRQNSKLDSIYDPHHPAVLRMIQMTVDNGHQNNCWVGICGELGSDTSLTGTFLEMGVDELSVSPSCVLPIRKIIRETSK